MKHITALIIFSLADSIIMVQPDSAVCLLSYIETSRLSEQMQVYHALLLTKAMSKVPITTVKTTFL